MAEGATPGTDREQVLAHASAQAEAGDYRLAIETLDAALQQCPPEDRRFRATVLAELAHLRPRLGLLHEAMHSATEAAELADVVGLPALQARALSALSYVYAQLLLGREALETALRGLDFARSSKDEIQLGWALNRLGVAYASLDDPAKAVEVTRQALELEPEPDPGRFELAFSCQNNLAYYWLQRLESARRCGDQTTLREAQRQALAEGASAVAMARESGSQFMVAVALSNLAEAQVLQSAFDAAQPAIDEYESLALAHGYQALALQATMQRALMHQAAGDLAAAVALLSGLYGSTGEPLPPKLRRKLVYALYECHKAGSAHQEALAFLEQHVELERQIAHDTRALQTEVMLVREQARQAHVRAEQALHTARTESERARQLEQEQERWRDQAERWGRAALEDSLTGLHNRRHAERLLPLLAEEARLKVLPINLAMLDVDHFKTVNDRFGHAIGDQVLRHLAQLLRQKMRSADLLARVGGEEFLIAIVGSPPEVAYEVCDRLRLAVAGHPWDELASGLRVRVSIGLAGGAAPDVPAELLERADRALYAAKHGGRDQVQSG